MPPVTRANYFSGQYLRTAEFVDEQRYHLDMRRRHNIAHHRLGIVTGLELIEEEGAVYVMAGLAVDGYGRELVVPARRPVAVTRAFQERDSRALEVWLAYDLRRAADAPQGYATCADDDTVYRVTETPTVRFTTPDLDETDRRCPATVPDGDCPFPPQRTPPDDSVDDWPVYLGTITVGSEDDETDYTIDGSDRPYAGLVGEEIVAPSGKTTVQVGIERDEAFRFAVRLPTLDEDRQPKVPRLAVDKEGNVIVAGETTFLGNVKVDGFLEIVAGTVANPTVAQPGTLSRAVVAGGSQLRLEMEDTAASSVAIGTWNADTEAFESILTIERVGTDNTVTVHGDLIVEGAITDLSDAGPSFSQEARALLSASRFGGITGAASLLPNFFKPPSDPSGGDE